MKKFFSTALATASLAVGVTVPVLALSTVEIVAKVKPSVVLIKVWNSKNPATGELGTGFFIDNDRIITDAHVISGDYDSI